MASGLASACRDLALKNDSTLFRGRHGTLTPGRSPYAIDYLSAND